MKPIPKLLVAGVALAVPLVAMAVASSKAGPAYVVIKMTGQEGEGKYAFTTDKGPRSDYVYFGVPRSLAGYGSQKPVAQEKGAKPSADAGSASPSSSAPASSDKTCGEGMVFRDGSCISVKDLVEREIVCVPASCNPPVPRQIDPLWYDPNKTPPADGHFFQLIIGIDSNHLYGQLKKIR